MKRNIPIGGAADKPEEAEHENPSTAELRPLEALLRPTAPAKPAHSVKRNILLLASVLTLPICTLAAEDPKRAADSTGRNAPVHATKPPTSTDQSERPEERKLTQAIREAVMKDKSLTMMARYITIITANNRVMLRGLVANVAEKNTINNLARAAAGGIPVDNQIEVKAAK